MNKLIYLSLFFAILITQGESTKVDEESPRIYNGKVAEKKQFPYMVSLWHNNARICSASMITSSTVLASAHCMVKKPGRHILPVEEMKIKYGSLDGKKGNIVKLEKLIPHPGYGMDNTAYNDIALVITKTPLPPSVKQIAIPPKSIDIVVGTDIIEVGWGRNSNKKGDKGYKDNMLRFTYSKIAKKEKCKFNKKQDDKTKICAAKINGSGICPGDSGGPLVMKSLNGKDIAIGTASYLLENCFQNKKDVGAVYARVSHYTEWITKNAKGGVEILS